MLVSVEIMLNAAGLAFIVAAARWGAAGRAGDVYVHPGDGGGGSIGRPGTDPTVISSAQNTGQ